MNSDWVTSFTLIVFLGWVGRGEYGTESREVIGEEVVQ